MDLCRWSAAIALAGGFGSKLFLRADALLAALGARAARGPVKLALQRALVFNNTTHRPAIIQRIHIVATRDGRITAIGHESWSGNLPEGTPTVGVQQAFVQSSPVQHPDVRRNLQAGRFHPRLPRCTLRSDGAPFGKVQHA